MKNYFRLFGLIGIGIFIYLILNIDLSTLLTYFKSMNYFYFFISLLFIFPLVITKTIKWLLIVEKEDRISLREGIFAWAAGFAIGIITPGKFGDFTRARFLKTKIGKSLLTVFVDRLNDVFVLFILGIFSIFFLFSKETSIGNLTCLFVFFFILFIIGILVIRSEKLVRKIGRPLYRGIVPKKYKGKIGENFGVFYGSLRKLDRKKIGINFLLTILAWFIGFIQYFFLSLAFGLNLSYLLICLIIPLLFLVQLIPISISGIGTREATAVLLLSTFGISPELAIAFSLGILIENYILGIFGFIVWIKCK